jgi:hypothetical protein
LFIFALLSQIESNGGNPMTTANINVIIDKYKKKLPFGGPENTKVIDIHLCEENKNIIFMFADGHKEELPIAIFLQMAKIPD